MDNCLLNLYIVKFSFGCDNANQARKFVDVILYIFVYGSDAPVVWQRDRCTALLIK